MAHVPNSAEQYEKMIGTPIPQLVSSLAIPTTISMLVTVIYNTADTYFVSQINKSASAAVGMVYTLMAILQAVGYGLGMGAGSLISRKLGEKDDDAAERYAVSAFVAAILAGAVVGWGCLAGLKPILRALKCTDTMLPYAVPYARWILARRAGQLRLVRAEQHAPRRGRIDARHVGAWTGRRAEYRARSPVHLHAGHGRRRRGAGHSRQSGRELCDPAAVLPDGPLHRPAAPAQREPPFPRLLAYLHDGPPDCLPAGPRQCGFGRAQYAGCSLRGRGRLGHHDREQALCLRAQSRHRYRAGLPARCRL